MQVIKKFETGNKIRSVNVSGELRLYKNLPGQSPDQILAEIKPVFIIKFKSIMIIFILIQYKLVVI